MKPRAKYSSRQGLLLIEAVLSAVVIATGLVFISRGLGSQLKALRSVEEYDTLVSLAQGKLQELEGRGLFTPPLSKQDQAGTFEEPYTAYRWTIEAKAREEPKDAAGNPMAKTVTVTIQHRERTSSTVTLSAIWPANWVDEWH